MNGRFSNIINRMITLSQKVIIPDHVIFKEVSGEAVLLNQASGKYFSLDDVGTRMWVLMAQKGRLAQVHQDLLAEYEVEPGVLEQHLLELVVKLVEQSLLQVAEG